MDERISNYTASLASSVVDYPIEYGRRYHAFRPGVYAFPNDEAEMDRLDMSHAVKVRSIGNKLFLAPLEKEKVHRILDIGTGTGIWAIEMGDVFENAEIIGIDLSPIQPKWVPPNVKFEVDDVESPWVVSRKYNYIMCRHMVASILDWPKLVRNIYETLIEACNMIGRDACPGPKVEGWVRDQGFRNVHHQKFMLPVGPWPKDPHYRDIGMLNLAQTLEGLEGFSLKLFCGVLGRTKEEVFVELSQVRKELKTGAFHAMFDLHVVYGQKPFETEAEE
ncbi:Secondary metabolism regulator LAE1 [Colletotrichum sp. SAR 10_98]|nr:Secondary metabolism regulator LAE1 [Colletotrichum sp. SAR 10_98]